MMQKNFTAIILVIFNQLAKYSESMACRHNTFTVYRLYDTSVLVYGYFLCDEVGNIIEQKKSATRLVAVTK